MKTINVRVFVLWDPSEGVERKLLITFMLVFCVRTVPHSGVFFTDSIKRNVNASGKNAGSGVKTGSLVVFALS